MDIASQFVAHAVENLVKKAKSDKMWLMKKSWAVSQTQFKGNLLNSGQPEKKAKDQNIKLFNGVHGLLQRKL